MIINAYYFRQHMYTLVPRHVREDMEWMAGIGTNAITLAVLEQDLTAAEWNLSIICEEARRVGMEVYAVPSRWGGIVAGAPKVPSIFSIHNPHTWVLNEEGKPRNSKFWGVTSSVHYPEVYDFYCNSLDKLLGNWPIKGIIWDEPKNVDAKDFSPKAVEKLGREAPMEDHIDASADFFDRVGGYVRSRFPSVRLSMFLYGHLTGYVVDRCASIQHLDDFGCDGKPWSAEDRCGELEGGQKTLMEQGPRFMEAARNNGKSGLILLENHAVPVQYYETMDRRLPEVLKLGATHWLYYYYPRNVEDPDRQMAIMAKHIRTISS